MKNYEPYLRSLVTDGSGLLGSQLCERLVVECHDVICLDNFFTGSKANFAQFLSQLNFGLIHPKNPQVVHDGWIKKFDPRTVRGLLHKEQTTISHKP